MKAANDSTSSPSLFDTPVNSEEGTGKTVSPLTSAAVVRQEANLLRFPFFALGRRGLQNHKGLLIRGQSKLDYETYDFEYRITCNSDDLYPGQFARKVHMGLLRIMQSKQSFPFANPIEFTWCELMKTMGITASGRTQQQLKQAIRSISGTRIRTKHALKNAHGQHLKSRERGYGLYNEYVFFDELMPDNETVADKNFLWLADWYVANINSLYCSPIDFALWQRLDDVSPIASRLYEFFTFNFSGDWQTFPIDYEKLARFLPVAPEKHLSQIKKQLGTALNEVLASGVLAKADWKFGKHGQVQLEVRRGPVLQKRGFARSANAEIDDIESTEIRELYRQARPEDELVCQFHERLSGDEHYHPTPTERSRAKEVIGLYGQEKAESLLPFVVELVREHFPGAKSFGGSGRYWGEAAAAFDKSQRSAERRKQEFVTEQIDYAKRNEKQLRNERLHQRWESLSRDEQEVIRKRVLADQSPSMKSKLEKLPNVLLSHCYRELEKDNK
jgi:hypothetical protein